jgi:hypothetical protein
VSTCRWATAKWLTAKHGRRQRSPQITDSITSRFSLTSIHGAERTDNVTGTKKVRRKKFDSEGWATEIIDGHDVVPVLAALDHANAISGQPQAILALTIKWNGVISLAGKEHGRKKPIRKIRSLPRSSKSGRQSTCLLTNGKSDESTSSD